MQDLLRCLQKLVGLELTSSSRAADMECLKFGDMEYALHLQCPWRFTLNGEILVGDQDFYESEDSEGAANLRDHRLQDVIFRKPKVTSVSVDKVGRLELAFELGFHLSIFPNESQNGEERESWRLLNYKEKRHLVMSTTGCEIVEDSLKQKNILPLAN